MKRLILLAFCVCILTSCSKSAQQNQSSAQQQPPPKKYFYFVRKLAGKLSTVQPDLGEFKDAQRVEGQITGSIVQTSSGGHGRRRKTELSTSTLTLLLQAKTLR